MFMANKIWYDIVRGGSKKFRFNVPLDTLQVISKTILRVR